MSDATKNKYARARKHLIKSLRDAGYEIIEADVLAMLPPDKDGTVPIVRIINISIDHPKRDKPRRVIATSSCRHEECVWKDGSFEF